MTPIELRHQLDEEIDSLQPEQQARLLELARSLKQKRELPEGTPWSELKQFSGILPDEDAAEIMAAIEEGCENIDYEGW